MLDADLVGAGNAVFERLGPRYGTGTRCLNSLNQFNTTRISEGDRRGVPSEAGVMPMYDATKLLRRHS